MILNEDGAVLTGPAEGYLVFKRPWPGMMRDLFNNHPRYESTYFSRFEGYYCTGDGELKISVHIIITLKLLCFKVFNATATVTYGSLAVSTICSTCPDILCRLLR